MDRGQPLLTIAHQVIGLIGLIRSLERFDVGVGSPLVLAHKISTLCWHDTG
jgi:hypothetical protein